MILGILERIYSWPFLVGVILGFIGDGYYRRMVAMWEDNHHPLPGGRKHTVAGISRMWLATLLTVGTMGYVLLLAERTHENQVALGKSTAKCQEEFNEAVEAQIKIHDQDLVLARQQRDLMTQLNDRHDQWVSEVIQPPVPDIAKLAINDDRREIWSVAVTNLYIEDSQRIRQKLDTNSKDQDKLANDRAAHPLPKMTCGR